MMAGADAFLRVIRTVVEILRHFLIGFPKGDIIGFEACQFARWIIRPVVADDCAIDRVTGYALLALRKERAVRVVCRAVIELRIVQGLPGGSSLDFEPRGAGCGSVKSVEPAGPVCGVSFQPIRPRENVTVIRRIHMHGQHLLLEIIEVPGLHGTIFCARQGGQQQRGENSDDGNDHQEFDQGKSFLTRELPRRSLTEEN